VEQDDEQNTKPRGKMDLHFSFEKVPNTNIIKLLLEKGSDIDAKDDSFTVFHGHAKFKRHVSSNLGAGPIVQKDIS